mgnify:FL=1
MAALFEKKEIKLKIIKTRKLRANDATRLLKIISMTCIIDTESDVISSKHFTQKRTTIKHIPIGKNDFIDSKYFFI